MESNEKSCEEIINLVISKYSNLKTGETSIRFEYAEESTVVLETMEQFWDWFCESMKDEKIQKCFAEASREDYYDVLDEIKSEYEKKCK